MDYIDWFSNIEAALHSQDKPYLVMVYYPLYFCIQFANTFLRSFAPVFMSDIGL